jgi:hypothetical protein
MLYTSAQQNFASITMLPQKIEQSAITADIDNLPNLQSEDKCTVDYVSQIVW